MLAKFRALESGQAADTGIEGTGMGLIGGGKAFQIDEIGKGIEAVSADKVKAVSFTILWARWRCGVLVIYANILQAAKALLDSKASVSTVGDLYALPYASDIGLSV
jgi:ubiquinol-cytochrome c reductase core subunit 2